MLFYLNQFELHLKENILKKGFLLFQNGLVFKHESLGKFVVKEIGITLQIKNNQLQGFTCQCQESAYCEHLAAALFYIQQQKLHLSPDVHLRQKNKNKSSLHQTQLNDIQQIIFKSSLVGFSNKNRGNKNKKSIDYYHALLNLLRSNLKAFHPNLPLNQNQIDELMYVLKQASKLIQANDEKYLLFDWYLALYSFFIFLEDYRFAGDETNLFKIQSETEWQLKKAFSKGLDIKQKQSWLKASLLSIQSNKHIKNKAFYILLPRYLSIANKQTELLKIEAIFKKRVYKQPYYEALSKAQTVLHLIYFKMHQVPKKINFDASDTIEAEFLIALCDFYFLKNKPSKAFELVDQSIQYFQSKNSLHLRTFTSYAIEKSIECNMPNEEIKYLRFSFIYNYAIHQDEIKRFKELVNKSKWNEELNALIEKIKNVNAPFAFEKITTLLLLTENYDELIQILLQEKNRFKLLHETILKTPAQFDLKLMKVYAKQLGYALREANTFARQKQIIELCKGLLTLLSDKNLELLFNLIINETGYESQIGKYILEVFEGLMVSE